MESAIETTSVVREIAIAASPETVWQFLVDPERATLWMGQVATFDPRPGGVYKVDVIPGHTASGEFVELDPPHRLVQTWGWEPGNEGPRSVPPGSSTIEIELASDGDGTLLRFTHRDLPDSAAVTSHARGWDHYLERLAIAAAGGDPGPDPWISGPMS
ncbi:MAG: transcriptional regulator [Actinobacteria bacterium]|nr:MAG: transcriptional regulator [Actinomycetota bacterium]